MAIKTTVSKVGALLLVLSIYFFFFSAAFPTFFTFSLIVFFPFFSLGLTLIGIGARKKTRRRIYLEQLEKPIPKLKPVSVVRNVNPIKKKPNVVRQEKIVAKVEPVNLKKKDDIPKPKPKPTIVPKKVSIPKTQLFDQHYDEKVSFFSRKVNVSVVCLLIILLIPSLYGNIVLIPRSMSLPDSRITLRVGIYSGHSDLDPVRSWDSASNNVIEQVCEGLYMYNLSDPNLGIVPILASDYGTWDITGKHFTIPLRRDVWFHDGTPFNAEAVKWNFERINWFINGTGTLPPSVGISQIHSLYEFPNGTTILDPINPVTINSEHSVTINLRAPYAILESLLCYVTAYMLSPTSTHAQEYISTATGKIVGTGPFVYEHYIANTEVVFSRWFYYWRRSAYFERLIFVIIEDSTTRNNAMLGHSIDYLTGSMSSLFPVFDSDPTITHHSNIQALSYYYLGMNNKIINKTWRQAISYAINYTYIIEQLQDGIVYRSNGPLAPNFPLYDPNIKAATWDLAKARTLVKGMFPNETAALIADNLTTGANDNAWKALSLQTWNYTYNIGNSFREDLGVLLLENLNHIGIDVYDGGMSWSDFIYRIHIHIDYDHMELYWIGRISDYLSPYNMISLLFSNNSASNTAQYHNHTVEMWLEDVLSENNATKRAELYSKILHQIVEVDMPHAFGYHPYQHSIHSAELKNVPYNSRGNFYAWPIYSRWIQ